MLPSSRNDIRGNSDLAPWTKALKPIDAINEMPELIEVEDNFNEDQQKQYRSQSNYEEANSSANKN